MVLIMETNQDVMLQCDYCKSVYGIKLSSYKRRQKESIIKKDACSHCVKHKIEEVNEELFRRYVESIYDDSNREYKEVPLGDGLVTVVDSYNYDMVIRACRWYYSSREGVYGRIRIEDSSFKRIYLHRFIMGLPPAEVDVVHLNGDKLCNVESNLKIVPVQGNNKIPTGKTSRYKGVTWHKVREKWEVRIGVNGYLKRIGFFTDEVAAANAYNYFAKLFFGDYAYLNDVPYMEEEEWRIYNTGKQLYAEDVKRWIRSDKK